MARAGPIATCLAVLVALMCGLTAMAQPGPSSRTLDTLFERLKTATDPGAIEALEAAIWDEWVTLREPELAGLMADGIRRLQRRDFAGAIASFDRLIERAPHLSEAWNKRATAHWLNSDHEASVRDIAETLKREPRHFGALSGLGMIYAERGQYEAAIRAWEAALLHNPHMAGVREQLDKARALAGAGKT
ncbi:MAG: tetratricopeptide repeat protein [Alphaproteobacteria bacterium]|nr:tetratricopeptide repeat protein [Alphaproteobacteria bacterium]